MPHRFRIPVTEANIACDALVDRWDGGTLSLYDGTQPATPETAVTTQVLLAVLTLGTPAFGSATGGVATANAITGDAAANATGTATWFRGKRSGGQVCGDGSVDETGGVADLLLDNKDLVLGQPVNVTSFTYEVQRV
jgi:hypothetical protein